MGIPCFYGYFFDLVVEYHLDLIMKAVTLLNEHNAETKKEPLVRCLLAQMACSDGYLCLCDWGE